MRTTLTLPLPLPLLLLLLLLVLAPTACSAARWRATPGKATAPRASVQSPRTRPRPSRAVGLPWAGRLVGGVQLPPSGRHYFTWDPVLRRSPDRGWRRWGTDRLVRTVLRVVRSYADAHPSAPRVGIGDLSRPHGGDFGRRFGGIGHASHQNGLDVDVFYPRRDGRERAPERVGQIDRRLSQDLVDRFVAAGAARVFVGPHTGLGGPPEIVQPLVHHDNHLHFRLPSARSRKVRVALGLS